MNTTVEYIQKYVKDNYDLDFKLEYIGTHRFIKYIKNKKEYTFTCDYAQKDRLEYWSIYYDFMDYKNWYGNGAAVIDNGDKTIDEILKDWGFVKNKQMTIFDLEGE